MAAQSDYKLFRRHVWDFYTTQGRHELPWRAMDLQQHDLGGDVLDPYAIVVSEIMLQQTQVERVIPKYEAWLTVLPDWVTLAAASKQQILTLWQGLGYNRRALALAQLAQQVTHEYAEKLPRTEAELLELPGIGPYTAAAVRAFAFNEPVMMIETNIRTVFIHHFFEKRTTAVPDTELVSLITATLDTQRPREWYWALMDYGSHLKRLHGNPARRSAHHVRQSPFVGSKREVRGAVVRLLTATPRVTEARLMQQLPFERSRITSVLKDLERDGFVVRDGHIVQIAE